MASAVYTEPPASRLSISLESPASASPFPSPSSSFLTPPMPGAHEFAVKPALSARAGRKGSVPSLTNTSAGQHNTTISSTSSPSASPRTSAIIASSEGFVSETGSNGQTLRSSLSNSQLGPSLSTRSEMVDGATPEATVPGDATASHPQDLIMPQSGLSPLPSPKSGMLVSPATPTPTSVQRQPAAPPTGASSQRGPSLETPRSPAPFGATSSTNTPTVPVDGLAQEPDTKPEDEIGSSTPLVSRRSSGSHSSVNHDVLSDSLAKIANSTPSSNAASTSTTSPQIVATSSPPRTRPTISTRRSSRPLSTASISSASSIGSSTSASGTVLAFDPALFSSRPAPPSPGPVSAVSPTARPSLSRTVSNVSRSSIRERPSDRSRPPSTAVSRANSIKSKRASASSTSTGAGVGNPHPHPMPGTASFDSVDTNNTNTLNGRVGESPVDIASPNAVEIVNTSHQLPQHRVSVGSQLNPNFKLPLETHKEMGSAVSAILGSGSTSGGVDGSQTSIAPSTSSGLSSSDPQPSVESISTTSTTTTDPPQLKEYIKIRDFGFDSFDERHRGLGEFVPKPNRVLRMNKRLEAGLNGGSSRRTNSTASFGSEYSVSSSDGDGPEEDPDNYGWGVTGYPAGYGGFGRNSWSGGGGGGGFKMGMGRFSWSSGGGGAATAATIFDQEKAYATAAANLASSKSKSGYPSQSDMDRNFLDSSEASSEEYYDAEDDDDEYDDDEDGEPDVEEETLYPGLYRAMYAFEPEGTAEMKLEEDQIVRVVGRGGGVGWAVVVAGYKHGVENEGDLGAGAIKPLKHALVPESYLEPYKLDWELDDEAVGRSTPSEE